MSTTGMFKLSPEQIKEAAKEYSETDISLNALSIKLDVSNHTLKSSFEREGVIILPKKYGRSYSTEFKQIVVEEYREGKLVSYFLKRYRLCHTQLMSILKEMGCPKRSEVTHIPENKRTEICDKYKNGVTMRSIVREYRTTHRVIEKIIDMNGISKRSNKEHKAIRAKAVQKDKEAKAVNLELGFTNRWRNNSYRKNRDIEWNLTHNDIESLWSSQNGKCYYTGIDMVTARTAQEKRDIAHSPYIVSLDRIDSSKGYVKDNVCLCTAIANFAKNDYTEEQFRSFLSQVAANLAPQSTPNPSELYLCA